ncbi:type III-B CRISPR module-associated Cmr3 family protein [Thiorhodovibrio frisius]|uniref:CRISPR-associated protein (Cas_Cmr3) n=1 Tax=Thiorhodovibrio frisius TaxID=631362 RepID=H8Z1Z4_9GAMM|nr:type III-B CRISPR module-associated Cmr3 family protein [Thiorhodovibrio frisius]EIC21519.1 CRISPR-associated protein (Cas_Cmr3) [Thiorhodovibrio frisius]WPL24103.1 CRISPR type III-B/RAMP module-associated protein Cmr3 [Thiorhodovibrio frisius]
MTAYRFLQPLDVLFLRGNKLFGQPGSFGESLIPPPPSAAAGALRSLMLAADGVALAEFASGQVTHTSIGTPTTPGSFRLTECCLARRAASGAVERLIEPPADLFIARDGEGDDGGDDDKLSLSLLHPQPLPAGLMASSSLPRLPILGESERRKPGGGLWLTEAGFVDYLAGRVPAPTELIPVGKLWQLDPRISVGLDTEQRRADDGKLFSAQAVAFQPEIGFLVGIAGAEPPATGLVRLGGDGRGAALSSIDAAPPVTHLRVIAKAHRCRLVLTSPGIFPDGWRLPGTDSDGRFALHGVRARLVSAAVPRAQTVSGWDLANWEPKTAQRAAPAGSVYWLDELEATPAALGKLAAEGLWSEPCDHPQRRAEGFNRFSFALWP